MGLTSRVSSRTYRFPLKMFDAKLQNGLNLKKCVNALKELIEQGAWDVTEDGIQMQSMDSSHVALVQMNISDTSFETFRCDQAMQMGLNMGNLFKIFGAFTNGSVHIQADGEDADTVKWVFETASDGKPKAKKNRMKVKRKRLLIRFEVQFKRSRHMSSDSWTWIWNNLVSQNRTIKPLLPCQAANLQRLLKICSLLAKVSL